VAAQPAHGCDWRRLYAVRSLNHSWAGVGVHVVVTLAHDKIGIAHQDESRWPKAVVDAVVRGLLFGMMGR
jgi:hypothetical protein